MPDTYTSQFSGEEIDSALRAAQIISGASTPAELRKKLEIRGDTIPVSATDPTPVSEALSASGGGINPNLLDNWFFGRPVNQRGQTEYNNSANGATYSIDRWLVNWYTGKITLSDNGVLFNSVDSTSAIFRQKICTQEDYKYLVGKQVTISALINGELSVRTGVLPEYSSNAGFGSAASTDRDKRYFIRLICQDSRLNFDIYINAGDPTELPISAAKLELGSTQTLAHKENGVWVLNEIPDFGEQLRRCRRYCKVFPKGSDLPVLAFAQPEKWYLSAFIPYDDMRTVPAHNIGSGIKCHVFSIDSDDVSASETIMNWGATPTGQKLRLSDNAVSSAEFPFRINLDADLIFSADL